MRPQNTLQHSRSLDGLRWISFLAVFVYHANERLFPFGKYGVQMFFVLSGFLIGNNLLRLRESDSISIWTRLRTFYARRSLRIFPLYYFVLLSILALGLLGGIHPRWGVWPFHATYLTNVYLFFTGADIDSQTHFWSLSVEEHFYLVAPLALLCLSYSRLAVIFAVLLMGIPVLRALNVFVWGSRRFEYLSFMQFDLLAMGMWAAMLLRQPKSLGLDGACLRKAGALCGALASGMLAWTYFPSRLQQACESILLPSALSVAGAALVSELWRGELRAAARFLSWPPFVYLGTISYGLYIYHNFLFVVARRTTGLEYAVRVLLSLALTIGTAALSWHLLEKPFIRLKDRFGPAGGAEDVAGKSPRKVESIDDSSICGSETTRGDEALEPNAIFPLNPAGPAPSQPL